MEYGARHLTTGACGDGHERRRVELGGGVFTASMPLSEVAQRSNRDGVRASGAVR
jgi:hypothetical protein